MSRPAVFVDRDGTLNRDCPYCHDPSDLYVYMDTVEMLRDYAKKGYYVFMVTNQSGINRKYFTVDEFNEFNKALLEEMAQHDVSVDDIFVCPHRPDEGCRCRKPGPGLIEQAIEKYDIDIARSVFVGDRDDMDGELARKFGMQFVHVIH